MYGCIYVYESVYVDTHLNVYVCIHIYLDPPTQTHTHIHTLTFIDAYIQIETYYIQI